MAAFTVQDRDGAEVRIYVAGDIEGGQGHAYRGFLSWECERHGRVCSPFTPVRLGDVLARAANDLALPDGAFTVLSRALRGANPVED